MFFVILLVLFGLLFLVAEIVLLPGISIGGVLALVSYGTAIYMAYRDYGPVAGTVVVFAVFLLSVVATIISLRSKTWQRFSLNKKIDAATMPTPAQENVKVGDRGTTLSRLSPMGTVLLGGRVYEAKLASGYADPKREIEVTGFDNASVIVKIVER